MNIGHIDGGTNAGWKKVAQRFGPWLCSGLCADLVRYTENPGYRSQCSRCGSPRPN